MYSTGVSSSMIDGFIACELGKRKYLLVEIS
jgi:hypothetical protein